MVWISHTPLYTGGADLERQDVGNVIMGNLANQYPSIREEQLAIIESRLTKVIALRRLSFRRGGVLPAMRRLKSYFTILYNLLKGGVDRSSKVMVDVLDHIGLRMDLMALIAWHNISAIISNLFCTCGGTKVRDPETVSVQTLRNKQAPANHIRMLKSLGEQLLLIDQPFQLETLNHAPSADTPSPVKKMRMYSSGGLQLTPGYISTPVALSKLQLFIAAYQAPVHQRSREWFDSPVGTQLRRSAHFVIHDLEVKFEHTRLRRCFACGIRKTQKQCAVCGLLLCDRCYAPWHNVLRPPTEAEFNQGVDCAVKLSLVAEVDGEEEEE